MVEHISFSYANKPLFREGEVCEAIANIGEYLRGDGSGDGYIDFGDGLGDGYSSSIGIIEIHQFHDGDGYGG